MALRRTLSLRSLFSARSCQPSPSSIILRDIVNHHEEEKPSYHSLLHQRSFSSSILSQHLISSPQLSLRNPLGVSVCRSMSTSHAPGFDVNKDSVLQDEPSQAAAVLTKVVDAAHQLVDRVHSSTGLNW